MVFQNRNFDKKKNIKYTGLWLHCTGIGETLPQTHYSYTDCNTPLFCFILLPSGRNPYVTHIDPYDLHKILNFRYQS